MSSIAPATPSPTQGRFEAIVEATPCALLLVDARLRIRLVNSTAEALFGYSRADLLDHSIDRLTVSGCHPMIHDSIARLFADPGAGKGAAELDIVMQRRDGSEISVLVSMKPVQTDADRWALLCITQGVDVSTANETAQSMVALVESADDAIVTKSLDGLVRSWNPAAERLLGYHAAEIVGQPITRLIPLDRQDEERMIIDRITRGLRVEHFETIRCRKDGTLVPVSLTISPIRDRLGVIIGASKIMRDITDRKKTESQLRRTNDELARINSDLEDFVYTASHDLRAPLTGIKSVVQWILDDDPELSTESRARMALIQVRIERMKRLLNDIRDYAQSDSKYSPSGPKMSAAEMVEGTAVLLGAGEKFAILADPSLAGVFVQRVPLEQILNNLIGNAIKHHDRREGSVTVSVAGMGDKLRFFVADDGPGVPVEYREAIFEMFKTLKPRDEVEGSGMGLALVRKVVHRMGGACGIEPALPRGSIFWFDWPRLIDSNRD